MTTPEQVTPALTPEEWAKLGTGTGGTGDVFVHPDGAELCLVLEHDKFVGIVNRRATAALALHGTPEGFTREMLDWLRLMAGAEQSRGYHANAQLGLAIAARINALLPPEGPTDV